MTPDPVIGGPVLSEQEWSHAFRVIRKFYGLGRGHILTHEAVRNELINLTRKRVKGSMDDIDEALAAALAVGNHGIKC